MKGIIKKIDSLAFGLMSPESIRKMSVAKIETPDTYDEDGYPIEGGLMDRHLGVIDPSLRCQTCNEKGGDCQGHFGHIDLGRPVIHVGYGYDIYKILRSVCSECSRILLEEDEIEKCTEEIRELKSRGENLDEYLKEVFIKCKSKKERAYEVCPHCGAMQKDIKIDKPTTFVEVIRYDEKGNRLAGRNDRIVPEDYRFTHRNDNSVNEGYWFTERFVTEEYRLTANEVREKLESITDEDAYVLGVDTTKVNGKYIARPEWMVLTVLPVPSVPIRPSITLDTGERSEDDLSHKLVDILRINQRLIENMDAGAPQLIVEDLWELLQYHVTTYFDNEASGVPPARHRSGRPLKTLTQRLKGKEGRFRSNLSGKRVNFSARTVISPDPNISINEVGVPEMIAREVTVPIHATDWNFKDLYKIICRGPQSEFVEENYVQTEKNALVQEFPIKDDNKDAIIANIKKIVKDNDKLVTADQTKIKVYIDDKLYQVPQLIVKNYKTEEEKEKKEAINKIITDIIFEEIKNSINIRNSSKYQPGVNYVISEDGRKRKLSKDNRCIIANMLKYGDEVLRHLKDGDIVLFNRQPSLHRMNMMAHEVRVLPHNTFRINPSVCPPYNADFDGDEMNMHILQTPEARAEAKSLMRVQEHILSPRFGGPIIGAIHDHISGAYLLTRRGMKFPEDEAFQAIRKSHLLGNSYVDKKHLKRKGRDWTGKELFSLLLPDDLNMNYKAEICRKCDACRGEDCQYDAYVVIKDGELVSGAMDESAYGSFSGQILDRIVKEYGADRAKEFLDRSTDLAIWAIMQIGITTSLNDEDLPEEATERIEARLDNAEQEVDKLIRNYEGGFLEALPGRSLEETLEMRIMQVLGEARDSAGIIAEEFFNMDSQDDEGILDEDNMNLINHAVVMARTGARASMLNLEQTSACVGQQSVRGGRIERGYQKRALPHFKKGELGARAKGFVHSSYKEGLDPIEFFFHAMGGREGLVDTAIRTAQSGYMQRRLVNALEDLTVNNDGVVHNNNGQVVQTVFGEDGIDPAQSDFGKVANLDKIIDEMRVKSGEYDYKHLGLYEDNQFYSSSSISLNEIFDDVPSVNEVDVNTPDDDDVSIGDVVLDSVGFVSEDNGTSSSLNLNNETMEIKEVFAEQDDLNEKSDDFESSEMNLEKTTETSIKETESFEDKKTLENTLNSIIEDNIQLEEKIKFNTENNNQLNTKLELMSLDNDLLENKIGLISEDNNRLETQIKLLSKNNDKLNNKLRLMSEDNDRLKARISLVSQDKDELEEKLGLMSEDNERLKARISLVSQDKDELEEKLKSIASGNNILKKKLTSVSDENNDLLELNSIIEENELLKRELDISKENLKELNKKISSLKLQKTNMTREIDRIKGNNNTLADLNQKLEDKSNDVVVLERKLDDKSDEVAVLEQKIKDLETQKNELDKHYRNTYQERIKALEDKLDSKSERIGILENKIEHLEEESKTGRFKSLFGRKK